MCILILWLYQFYGCIDSDYSGCQYKSTSIDESRYIDVCVEKSISVSHALG